MKKNKKFVNLGSLFYPKMKLLFTSSFFIFALVALATAHPKDVDDNGGGGDDNVIDDNSHGEPGGLLDIPTDHIGMLAALQAVKDSFEAQLANFRFFTIGPVHSAQSQVVRGTNYYVNFTLTQRNCLEKGGLGGKEGVNCGPSRDLLCEVVINSPPDYTYELSSIDCK